MSVFDIFIVVVGQQWNVQDYVIDVGFVLLFGGVVVCLFDLCVGECIFDLGCGDGVFSIELVLSGVCIYGVDVLLELVIVVCVCGVDVQVMDGYVLLFDSEFDVVFSNVVLYWMGNLDCVLEGVCCVLCFGGCFVVEFGGYGNVVMIVVVVQVVCVVYGYGVSVFQWYFLIVDVYVDCLCQYGFQV